MKNIFKEGDKVFCFKFKWVIIDEEFKFYGELYYHVITENGEKRSVSAELLSFTEYTLEGFSQERPKEPLPFKEGDVVYVNDRLDNAFWSTVEFDKVGKNVLDDACFVTKMYVWTYLALENPLKNPDTRIYSKEDL